MELLFVVAAIVIMLFGFSLLYLELRRRSLQEKNDMLLRQKEIELLRQQVAANQTKEQTLLLKSQETSTSVDALNRAVSAAVPPDHPVGKRYGRIRRNDRTCPPAGVRNESGHDQ